MSTGLAYRPCFYAKTDELIRVAQILAKHNKVYASHLRNGPNGAIEAVEIGEKAGCRVQLSHFRNAKSAFDLVTDANRRGIVTCADIIPQSTSHRRASNRMLEALMVFYPGVFDADDETLKSLVRNPKTRAEITKTIQFFNNDKNDVIIVHALTPKHKANEGKSIAALAKAAGKDPNDYFIEVILDESNPVVFAFDGDRREARAQGGGGGRGQNPADQVPQGSWTTHDRFGPGSDSIPVDQDEPFGWYEHQRRGAFPGYFRQAKSHNVPLEKVVQKATQLPAEQFRIKDRGVLEKGKVADVMVFNPDNYSYPTPAESDPNDPHPVAKGVAHVVVNGVPVLVDGQLTKQKPGKVSCSGRSSDRPAGRYWLRMRSAGLKTGLYRWLVEFRNTTGWSRSRWRSPHAADVAVAARQDARAEHREHLWRAGRRRRCAAGVALARRQVDRRRR